MTGSNYANKEYVYQNWIPLQEFMQAIFFDTFDVWMHPVFIIFTLFPYPPFFGLFTLVSSIIWLAAIVPKSLTYQDLALTKYAESFPFYTELAY